MITPYFNDNDNFILYQGDTNCVLSEIKDKKQREQISKMKRLYALPDNRTEEQKERDFQTSFIDAFI